MTMNATRTMETYRNDMVAALSALIAVPSVKGEPVPGAPFGAATIEALHLVLSWGEKAGFRTKELDGMCGWLECGEGPRLVAALCHLDVVPAGSGWTGDPFTARVENGRIVGRGAIDDKGPAVAAFFALKALADRGLPPGTRFRLILGLDEESGSQCMVRYCETEELPTLGFTPDADFPVINAEKGIRMVRLSAPRTAARTGAALRLVSAAGGSRPNMVPGLCTLVFACDPMRRDDWVAHARNLPFLVPVSGEGAGRPFPVAVEAMSEPDRFEVSVTGKMAHASMPSDGRNAISAGLSVAASLLRLAGEKDAFVDFYRTRIDFETDGASFGCAASDDVSGALTLNVGILKLDEGKADLTIDVRCPVTVPLTLVDDAARAAAAELGGTVARVSGHGPLFVPESDPLVASLLAVYEKATGSRAKPISIGGGTYARSMPNVVAFGPLFPGRPQVAHQADEYFPVDEFVACAEIYLEAFEVLSKS